VRRTLANWGLFSLLVGLTAAGCSSTEKIRLTESGAPDFHQLNIVYDANSVGGLVAVSPTSAVQQASHSESTETDQALSSKRVRLEVQYPYPGLHAEFVHVTLRVLPPESQGPSTVSVGGGGLLSAIVGPPSTPVANPEAECLVLDMPKSELTAIFLALANDGFFKRPAVKDGASHLEVTYNKGQVEKAWNREPRIEQLVDLLKRHGTPAAVPR
jgi:hypothetical protein